MGLRLHREVGDAAGSLSLLTNDRFSSGKETGGDKKQTNKQKKTPRSRTGLKRFPTPALCPLAGLFPGHSR